jgi:hypothetical protein
MPKQLDPHTLNKDLAAGITSFTKNGSESIIIQKYETEKKEKKRKTKEKI